MELRHRLSDDKGQHRLLSGDVANRVHAHSTTHAHRSFFQRAMEVLKRCHLPDLCA